MKRIFSTGFSENGISFAALVLRLTAGMLMLVVHGLDKLSRFPHLAANFSDPFHIGPSTTLALVVFAEVFCSVFLILGLATRLVCIPLIINMSVALFQTHRGDIFGKGEMAALFLACYVALLFTGPGKVSIDRAIGK